MIKKITLFFLIVLSGNCFAATYYVQNGGDDNAAGTSIAPWANCPGMEAWSGGASLSPGDTVYFDSSDTWTLEDGSQGLWVEGGVTYIGDYWGGGTRAKFDGQTNWEDNRAVVQIGEDHATYETVFQGFEVDANMNESRGIQVNPSGAGNTLVGAIKRVENCWVHHIGDGSSGFSYGIIVSGTTNNTVQNVEILGCLTHHIPRSGIVLYSGYQRDSTHIYDVTIRDNEVHTTKLDLSAAGHGILVKNHAERIIIEYNYVHGASNAINVDHTYSNADTPDDITIRYNILTGGSSSGILVSNNPITNFYIYGNLIFENTKQGINFESNRSGASSAYVYNNTFYQNDLGEIWVKSASGSFSTLEIKNNIFYAKTGQLAYNDDDSTSETHNNNLYYIASGNVVGNGGSSYTTATVTNWEATAQSSNPNFSGGALPSGFDGTYGSDLVPNETYFLIETGDAVGGGADLGGSPYYGAINITGTDSEDTRDTLTPWDIGAYESGMAVPPPTRSGITGVTINP